MAFETRISEWQNKKIFNRLSNTKPLMKEISLIALSAIQKNIETNTSPKNAGLTKKIKQGEKTLRDSGALRKSLTARSTDTVAEVGTAVPYAKVHNPTDGRSETIIKPKKAKYLCIPASAKTRTLFRRYGWSPREVIAGLESDGHSVFRPYKKGTKKRGNVIFAKKKGGGVQPIFILKKEIKIPARPFMFLSNKIVEQIAERVGRYYDA